MKIEWFEIRQNYLSNIVFVNRDSSSSASSGRREGVTGEAKVSHGVHAGSIDTFKKG